ncbi:MAG: sulfotransferase [Pseudomonadota bacterium]
MNLPTFICPGSQKSATTTLHDILIQHGDIYLPAEKEAHFFDMNDRYAMGLAWYESQYFSGWSGEEVVGEVTPKYMFLPEVPGRIFESIGSDVQFIFMLRNPVDRAYSHYWMRFGRGLETRSFEEAVTEEMVRLHETDTVDRRRLSTDAYLWRGFYAHQISYFDQYFDTEKMLFIEFGKFVANKSMEVDRVLEFLGLAPSPDIDLEKRSNVARETRVPWLRQALSSGAARRLARAVVRSKTLRRKVSLAKNHVVSNVEDALSEPVTKPPLSPELRQQLVDFFARANEELAARTSLDLSTWSK